MKEILYAVLVLGIMGAVFGAVLAIASKVFAVKTDERLPKLVEALPARTAAAAASQAARPMRRPCSRAARRSACASRAVRPLPTGWPPSWASRPQRPSASSPWSAPRSPHRQGPLRRHPRLPLGHVRRRQRPLACPSGCLGFGSCVSVCRFDAIHVVDGVAKVDPEKCTGCLQCAAVCPRKVIVPVSYDADIVIACSNHERGAYTRRECDHGLRRLPPVRKAVRVRRHPRRQQPRRHRLFQVRLLRPLRGRVPAEAHLRFEPPAGYGRRPRHAAIKSDPLRKNRRGFCFRRNMHTPLQGGHM